LTSAKWRIIWSHSARSSPSNRDVPEVEHRIRPPVELHPEVLAPAAHRHDPTAPEGGGEAARAGPLEDDRVLGGTHGDDPASPQMLLGAPTRGLDLGQLGHVARVSPASPPQSRCTHPRLA
jgi:hypothetical protein